jgi:chromobox protein 1
LTDLSLVVSDDFESDNEDITHEPSTVEQAAEAEDQLNGELDDAGEEATGDRPDEDEELDDEEGEALDQYVVEAILDHRFTANDTEPYYKIKWEGFNKKSDLTWEPQENLFPAARQLLADYHHKIGGAPQPSGLKKRKSIASLKDSQTPEPKRSKRGYSEDNNDEDEGYTPKGTDWDKHVQEVQTIEKNAQTGKLDAYIAWKNGKKSKVGLDVCYKKLPQSMLKFYEAHL